MVDPATMCDKHLVAEHHEVHVFVGKLRAGHKVQGYIDNNLLELGALSGRHAELVAEMLARGFEHRSPLPEVPSVGAHRFIDSYSAGGELRSRCEACARSVGG